MFYIQKHYFFSHDFLFLFFLSLLFHNFLWKDTWKHVYLQFSTGSTQEGISWHNWLEPKNQNKQGSLIFNRFLV